MIALGETLRERISSQLNVEPRVGGSLFRIANDLRFAKDKPPYKTHLDFSFWQGPNGPRTDPSLLLRITPTGVHLGCGIFGVTGAALNRYRDVLHDPASLAALDARVTALLRAGGELSDPSRARPPAGFDPTRPAARFVVRDGFQVVRRYPRPGAVTSAKLVTWCADRFAAYGPVHAWLVEHATLWVPRTTSVQVMRHRVHARHRTPLSTTLIPASARIVSNIGGYLPSRSRMRNGARLPASWRSMARLRAVWVTLAAVGWAVAPRIRTRRVACSMTGRTYILSPVRVTVSKKSAARMASAWARKNVPQVWLLRYGAGSTLASLRISQTVDAATRMPRTRSPPWMRR